MSPIRASRQCSILRLRTAGMATPSLTNLSISRRPTMQAIETFTHRGFTVNIYQDTDAASPEYDDGLFIVTTKNREFQVLYEKQDAHELMRDREFCKKYWIFPLYAYIHSGVALSICRGGQFADLWDSGQIGFVFAAKSEWRYQFRNLKKCWSAYKSAESRVEEWNQYLSGQVYGFQIEDSEGEDVDSCWGFY